MLHGADGLNTNTQYRQGARNVAAAGYQVYLVHYLDRTGESGRLLRAPCFRTSCPGWSTVQDALAFVADQPGVRSVPDRHRRHFAGRGAGACRGEHGPARQGARDYFGPLPQGAIAATSKLPPTLVLHGSADPIVPVSNAYAVEALLRQQNVPHEIKVYPGQGHGFRGAAEERRHRPIPAFLQRHLAGTAAPAQCGPLPANG